jgi:hypothetical protein
MCDDDCYVFTYTEHSTIAYTQSDNRLFTKAAFFFYIMYLDGEMRLAGE